MCRDRSEAGLAPRRGPAIAGVAAPPGGNRKRRVVVILADTSHSMNWVDADGVARIDALNRQLAVWVPTVREAGAKSLADVEFAVVTFGEGGVRVLTRDGAVPEYADGGAFVPAAQLELGPLTAGGATPLVEAVERAIALARDRQDFLKETHNLMSGQPRLILFSDGQPTDDAGQPNATWRPLAERLKSLQAARRLQFFAFGVPGVDTQVMRQLVPDPDGYRELASMDFKLLLDLILIATSSADPYETLNKVFGK